MGNTIQRILSRNRNIFLEYNRFRKEAFVQLAPKDSEDILYLLPWLLSVNHPSCPGYILQLPIPFKVFNIDNDKDIRARETGFKRRFGINKKGSVLQPSSKYFQIHGLYTIGSVGSAGQTSSSDCDIWVCYDKNEFDEDNWRKLGQKLNLIKDWMDQNLKMPVFFFITDINDIREGNFGSVDMESSGSTQKNILKEEFYRTCIVICGKIPLWWICYDPNVRVSYSYANVLLNKGIYGEYDIIDFGNLESIGRDEYLGAALWQLHKSLTRPLKSIMKMMLLKMMLDAPYEKLLCLQFREHVLNRKQEEYIPDPSIFSMQFIFDHYQDAKHQKTLNFLKECFYLRCEIKPYERGNTHKKRLTDELFKRYPLDLKTKIWLGRFSEWDFDSQINLGNRLLTHLIQIYKEVVASHSRAASRIDKQDLMILGRRIAASYQSKGTKISVLQKPTGILNLSNLTLYLEDKTWRVCSGNDKSNSIVSNSDIVYNIAFIVWNNLFDPTKIRMEPNPSSVTLQEIVNLGKKLREFIGTIDVSDNELSNYLQDEHIVRLLIVISFEKSPYEKDINEFSIIYKNNWGEMFVRRFNSPHKLEAFMRNSGKIKWKNQVNYYLQRNSTYYDKIIERTKKLIMPVTEL